MNDVAHEPRFLLIHGRAASGKSVLASYAIDHLRKLGKPCHYFFIRFTDQQKRSPSTLLRSLAYQIAHWNPAYAAKLDELISEELDLRTANSSNIWYHLFVRTFFTVQIHNPVYWIIDGIDESVDSRGTIKLFSNLAAAQMPLRILLISRTTPEVESAFKSLSNANRGTRTMLTRGNEDDFRLYIRTELEDFPGRDDVIDEILRKAEGNFLWIHLTVQEINGCYSRKEIEDALKRLPAGMDPHYNRMARSIGENPNPIHRSQGRSLLAWGTCSKRVLFVNELGEAVFDPNSEDVPLDIQRSIGYLCGGFLVVDNEGKVAMIHETAREYLLTGVDRPFPIDKHVANSVIFERCMQCLMDSNLQRQINQDQAPALLSYAMSHWFQHLVPDEPGSGNNFKILKGFFQNHHVLTWIHAVSKNAQFQVLVTASRHLRNFALDLKDKTYPDFEKSLAQQVAILSERWATDLVKTVGKFGFNLSMNPKSIHDLVAPFCPTESVIYEQFGKSERPALLVHDLSNKTWDDCLVRFTFEEGSVTSSILAAGNSIAILTVGRVTCKVFIYNQSTFEEKLQITHPERVRKMQLNMLGTLLVTYGHRTTRYWDLSTGLCTHTIPNPESTPEPQTLLFTNGGKRLLVGYSDRRVRSINLDESSPRWEIVADIDEEPLEGTFVNSPSCMALSPRGDRIALGYRGHPATLWELTSDKGAVPMGHCMRALDPSKPRTKAKDSWGEVIELTWHPFDDEIFGLYLEGYLFKWLPGHNGTSLDVKELYCGGSHLAISRNGSLCATGDGTGLIRIISTAELVLLYQFSSHDAVVNLQFGIDSRRLFDVRRTHANVWEPNVLVSLAQGSDQADQGSDVADDVEAISKGVMQTLDLQDYVDTITSLSAQPKGTLYCHGTEAGVAILEQLGSSHTYVLERSKSEMAIEDIAWSGDGSLIAIADLGGKLTVKMIEQGFDTPNISPKFDSTIPDRRGVEQILFHPNHKAVLAVTQTHLLCQNIESGELQRTALEPQMTDLRWIRHPLHQDWLLGFGSDCILAFAWDTLELVQRFCFSRPGALWRNIGPTGHESEKNCPEELVVVVNMPILSTDGSKALLEVSTSIARGQREHNYFIFSLADIKPQQESLQYPISLSPSLVPPNITERIRTPLGFLSGERLVFLDVDRWVCTWQSTRRRSSARHLSNDAPTISQHYFLPGDWINVSGNALCKILCDGTLLYPRNGNIATVQATSLRN
jgi:WD40 repeat protein